jgi:hypothetical protein
VNIVRTRGALRSEYDVLTLKGRHEWSVFLGHFFAAIHSKT